MVMKKDILKVKLYWTECKCNMLNVYFVSVKWKNKLGGVRKINFSVGTHISGTFYTENKIA